MRLAISNIAWPSGADDAAAPILLARGVEGVEIAPTKIWPRPLEAAPRDVCAYRGTWERRGLRIVALQALLFGRPELTLFGEEPARRRMIDYLKGMIDLGAALGAEALVFGSPRNRRMGSLPRAEADTIAVSAFRELGDHASRSRVALCIEANPVDYGCDFVTTTAEAIELVERVGSEGFGLHVDSGGMTLSGEDPGRILAHPVINWRHFHISEPHLAPIGLGGADHDAFARALRRGKFDRWASIEMKEATPEGSWRSAVADALDHARLAYFETGASAGGGPALPSWVDHGTGALATAGRGTRMF